MSATRTATASKAEEATDSAISEAERRVDGARREVVAGFDALRSTAGDMGDRVPGIVDGLKSGAAAGAREIEGMPESTRNLVAALSVGLGAGLAIAGAPRLLMGAALLPAITVAVTGMRRTGRRTA